MSYKTPIIFDPIYGFIHLTKVEWEIIHSPFYQRLRWIRQLGFSSYVFHGAEHSRFGHSIGVMFNAHKILQSIGVGVSDRELFNEDFKSQEKDYHQSIRLGALMHDLGTFPFSHTTEMSYIKFAETHSEDNDRRKDDHEHLGSFIIKNTESDGGITKILTDNGLDPQEISDLVKGISPSVLANQILHAEIDCDRMDYLLRDAHYTGLKYGSYDRDYLLHHFKMSMIGGHKVLTIKHNALHCVEDFLNSRFAWYSQVVRSARGAKYDAVAAEICDHLLQKNEIYKYSDLLEMIKNDPLKFYTFNDLYFMNLVHQKFYDGSFKKHPRIYDMANCLLFEHSPKTIRCDEFNQILLNQDETNNNEKYFKKATSKLDEIKKVLAKNGSDKDWVLNDIPTKHIIFVKSKNSIVKTRNSANILLERDPVKISYENGDVKLLAEVENSTISKLQDVINFIPNVFCSTSAYKILEKEGIV